MAYLSDFMSPNKPRGTQASGPGSNGYWRREIYSRPGTYTFTARKRGRVKLQFIGAGGAAYHRRAGPSGAFGEKELMMEAGQSLSIVIGAGGARQAALNGAPGNGATTSISGAAVGGTPLTLSGGVAPTAESGVGAIEGRPSGPWDFSFPGATSTAAQTGAPSSASPFGAGYPSMGQAGSGWGGGSDGAGSASSHRPSTGGTGTPGLFMPVGEFKREFWDMRDVDSSGLPSGSSLVPGPGAGNPNGSSSNTSLLGGGPQYRQDSGIQEPAPGSGGGAVSDSSARGVPAGAGGNAIGFLFFDEVQ